MCRVWQAYNSAMPTPEEIEAFNKATRARDTAEIAFQLAIVGMVSGQPEAIVMLASATAARDAAGKELERAGKSLSK